MAHLEAQSRPKQTSTPPTTQPPQESTLQVLSVCHCMHGYYRVPLAAVRSQTLEKTFKFNTLIPTEHGLQSTPGQVQHQVEMRNSGQQTYHKQPFMQILKLESTRLAVVGLERRVAIFGSSTMSISLLRQNLIG